MNILLLNQYYAPDVAATGQLLSDIAEEFARNGHNVHVICSSRSYADSSKKYPTSQIINNVHVHRVKATGFGRSSLIGRLTDYLSFFFLAMFKALCLPKMDITVALTTPPFIAMIARVLRRIKGTQIVLWTMDLYPEVAVAYSAIKEKSLTHKILKRVSRTIYKKSHAIVSLGETMNERLIQAGADQDKITTIHNWVPAEAVKAITTRQSNLHKSWGLDNKFTLMYSGNMGLGHDLETIIDAVASLDNTDNLKLMMVGSGKAQQIHQGHVERTGVDCISFHPPVPLNQLSDSLAAADVHIVSQKVGTQGLIVPSKLYGVMAAGRPTLFIGPHDCEPAQIIKKSNCGIIVPPGDVHQVAEAINFLRNNPEICKEMGNRARHYYLTNYQRKRAFEQYNLLIESLAPHSAKLPHPVRLDDYETTQASPHMAPLPQANHA